MVEHLQVAERLQNACNKAEMKRLQFSTKDAVDDASNDEDGAPQTPSTRDSANPSSLSPATLRMVANAAVPEQHERSTDAVDSQVDGGGLAHEDRDSPPNGDGGFVAMGSDGPPPKRHRRRVAVNPAEPER